MSGKFSIVLTHYQQMKYIFTALDSILMQDYPNIELIITDDCSKEFDDDKIKKYVKDNQKGNISRVDFVVNESNIGTVKTLNKALDKITGDYVLFFAADDSLYNSKSISSIVKGFEKTNASVLACQSFLYDSKLRKNNGPYIDSEKALNEYNKMTPLEFFKIMGNNCVYAAGSCAYKTQVFKDNGKFLEQYKLVEDWSYWVHLLKNNVMIIYEDIPVLKHRDGGVSHNHEDDLPPHVVQYYRDLINIHYNEIWQDMPKGLSTKSALKIFNSSEKNISYFSDYIGDNNDDMLQEKEEILRKYFGEEYSLIKTRMYINKFSDFIYWHVIMKFVNILKFNKLALLMFVEWILINKTYLVYFQDVKLKLVFLGTSMFLISKINNYFKNRYSKLCYIMPLVFLITYILNNKYSFTSTNQFLLAIIISFIIIYYLQYILSIVIKKLKKKGGVK